MQKILIVDDSVVARLLIERMAGELYPEGECSLASSAEAAIEMLEGVWDSIDLALIDYNMPGMDGLEFAHEFRKHNSRALLFLVTANSQELLHGRATDQGVDVIHKPFTKAKLTERIEVGRADA